MTPSGPRLLITMGDVAGIGPEIIARGWPELVRLCQPIVIGDPAWMSRALELIGAPVPVSVLANPEEAEPSAEQIPLLPATEANLSRLRWGQISAESGQAAHDFLIRAIDLTLAGRADGIVTAPLHKEGLHAAGLHYPGHTEILAERCGVKDFAMLLVVGGLGVAHVTLHMALREVFASITVENILSKARLLDRLMSRILGRPRPRIGIAALNPHASDGGLFGDEESRIIGPAVAAARAEGLVVSGPWPADTLFGRASRGEFDAVVAMYHDQGHIALKLLGGWRAVNVTAGLPIVRTSVAHGTAHDIAGRGLADPTSLIEATRVAVRLTARG
jgi:4-hydroxythreonine-4-phosphate dehydrogenase